MRIGKHGIPSGACTTRESAALCREVAEKDKHIQSLEEKHVQAQGALEHYCDAAKEQRDQDQRKHESQLHEMHVEQRKLRETIAVKQDESTRLNRDNEQLLGEAGTKQNPCTSRKHRLSLSTLRWSRYVRVKPNPPEWLSI